MIRPCCIHDGIEELRVKFSTGFIMDFASDIPRLWDSDPTDLFDNFHWDWSRLGQKPKYNLYYTARARLIRLDDQQILWQGRCTVGSQDSRAEWLEFSQWTFPNEPFLRERLEAAAKKCAQELFDQWVK